MMLLYPALMFRINALGTVHVLKTCHEAKVKRILMYSTSEVYGTTYRGYLHSTFKSGVHSS